MVLCFDCFLFVVSYIIHCYRTRMHRKNYLSSPCSLLLINVTVKGGGPLPSWLSGIITNNNTYTLCINHLILRVLILTLVVSEPRI